MKNIILNSFVLLFVLSSCSKKTTSTSKETPVSPTILEVGDKKISTDDFLYVYEKNRKSSDSTYSTKELNEYMELFLKFQLKIAEAEAQGLDTLQSFKKEFNGYQQKLAKPYLSDETFTEKWAKIEYNRQKEEVNASHILIKADELASPKDTIIAFNKILAIKKEIEDGLNFGGAAVKYSEDPSAKMDHLPTGYKGNLGYFSAFDMVFEFENAAFENNIGDLVGPIKTKFGYHLLKINDRRPSKPKREVSHIMVLASNKINKDDSVAAAKKILAIHDKVTKDNWNEICAKFSEHTKTKNKNGSLGAIKKGGKLGSPEFEEVAFELKKPGDISKPVKSAYGWHIIKFDSEVTIPTYEEQRKELVNKVSKNGAIVEMGKKQFSEKIKSEYGFTENQTVFEKSKALIDSTYLTKKWSYEKNSEVLKLELFQLGGTGYTIADFFNYLKESRSWYLKKGLEATYMNDYENFKISSIFKYEEKRLPKKYPKYRHLVQEYRDGILLFDLMNKNIWSKSANDTVGLKNYFEKNRENYKWNQHTNATIYYLYDTTRASEIRALLKGNNKPSEEVFNKTKTLTLKEEERKLEKNKLPSELKDLKWKTGLQELNHDDYKIFVSITEIKEAKLKELNECKGNVISDYQTYLENSWIDELKKKHPYKIHESELEKLANK